MPDLVAEIFIGIIIAVVSSLVAVRLSLGKFRTERWWEKKADAYSSIIDALHSSKMFYDKHHDDVTGYKELSEAQEKELRIQLKIANNEILRMVNVGGFYLSDKALAKLNQYQQDSKKTLSKESRFEYLDAHCQVTDVCLKEIIELAKEDLKIE